MPMPWEMDWGGEFTTPPPTSPISPGYNVSQSEVENYVRESATKNGIDPDIALKVYQNEGRDNWQSTFTKNGKRETSYGPFQLYTGGGLGNQFAKDTGLNPADPKTWKENIDYAFGKAKEGGWGPWYGAKRAGITGRMGISDALVGGSNQDKMQAPWEMDWGQDQTDTAVVPNREAQRSAEAYPGAGTKSQSGVEPGFFEKMGWPSFLDTIHDVNTNVGDTASLGFFDEAKSPFVPVKESRKELAEAQERSPVASGVGSVAGTLMSLPVGAAVAPASLVKTALKSGALTGLYSGAYGFGSGEGAENRIAQGATGLGIGASLGFAAPVAARGVSSLAAPIANTVRGLIAPGKEAERRVAQTISMDRGAGAGLTPAQETVSATESLPVTNLERGGETTRALARSAANASPEARATLEGTIDDRFSGQSGRVLDWLRAKTGFTGDIAATREASATAARAANRGNYVAAYKAGNVNIASPEIARLVEAEPVAKALEIAKQQGKTAAIADKMPWQTGDRNTIQTWDYAQRQLRSWADRAAASGDKQASRVLNNLRKDLNAELDRIVPEFNAARVGAAKFFGAEDALEAGQKFSAMTVDMSEARRAIAKMSQAEKNMFAEGYVSSVMDKVNKADDRINLVKRIWGSPKAREQMSVALGTQRASEFETLMGVESLMDKARGAMGNSTTTRQLIEAGIVGGGAGYLSGDWQTGGIVTALTYGGRRGMAKIDQGVAKRVAEMLVSNDPQLYSRAITTISRNKAMLNSLRSYVATIAGQKTSQNAP